jgi:hypothetical protein
MANNDFRGFRNRDPIAREDVDPTAGDLGDNPLADLARLIGQRDRVNEFDRSARHSDGSVETLEPQAPAATDQDWAADERYAEPGAPQQYADEDGVQPRLPDYPSDPAYAEYERDDVREPAPAARYSEPAEPYDDPHDARAYQSRARVDDVRDNERSYDAPDREDTRQAERAVAPRYREEVAPPPRAVARQAPALAPQAHDDEEEYDEQWDDRGYDQSDIPDEYEDDTAGTSRRSGLAVVLAMLGLVLIGAAGAYAYRAMFGGAIMAPSLPPIIKPADGPNKIVPNRSDAQQGASNQAGGVNPGAPAQLVPREEQPVPVQPPPAPPKVLSQIPMPPAPSAAPVITTVPDTNAPPAPAPAAPKMNAPGQPQGTAPMPGEPKRVHTIAIPSDQVGNNATAAPPTGAPAPAARPRATEPATRPSPTPAPRAGANAPLSLVPGAQNSAPAAEPPRRVTRTEAPSAPVGTAPRAAAPSAGGYAVQITSQRSEAEAQAAFRELQAKFPGQLANRQPIIHRADLADKGTYYRAMVGPFGSSEAAASLCSSLKAAGGSCIVQKN